MRDYQEGIQLIDRNTTNNKVFIHFIVFIVGLICPIKVRIWDINNGYIVDCALITCEHPMPLHLMPIAII